MQQEPKVLKKYCANRLDMLYTQTQVAEGDATSVN